MILDVSREKRKYHLCQKKHVLSRIHWGRGTDRKRNEAPTRNMSQMTEGVAKGPAVRRYMCTLQVLWAI